MNESEGEKMGLSATVREVISDGVGPDPHDIALKVLERIPFGDEREYLSQLLPDYCRELIRAERNGFVAPEDEPRASSGRIEGKWSHVKSVFQTAYYVAGEWKFLGDLTADDVEWVVSDYGKRAAENIAKAESFTALKNLMRRHKATTVSDLPVGKVEEVMS